MPDGNGMVDNEKLRINILGYGKPKTKKTWWSYRFAEAGFNVIHLCIDVGGYNIIRHFHPSTRKRINIVDLGDKSSGPVAPIFLAAATKPMQFIWDEKDKSICPTTASLVADRPYAIVDFEKLGLYDIVVIDSWTSFCWSLNWAYALETGLDFDKVTPEDQKRNEFGWTRHFATRAYRQLQALGANLIILAHEDQYEKRKLVPHPTRAGKKIEEIEWVRTQIKSTSGNHARQMGQDFEFLYFYMFGQQFSINTTASNDREGGTRIIPPGDYDWNKLGPKEICDYLNIKTPSPNNPESEAVKFYARGDAHPEFGWMQKRMEERKEEIVRRQAGIKLGTLAANKPTTPLVLPKAKVTTTQAKEPSQ